MVDIIALRGGTGNQLFGWALGRALRARGRTVFYESSILGGGRRLAIDPLLLNDRVLKLDKKFWAAAGRLGDLGLLSSRRFVRESSPLYDARVFDPPSGPRLLHGYWQSPKYFEGAQEDIICRVKCWLDDMVEVKPNKVISSFVAVHVRRGDYVSNPAASKVLGTLEPDYQRKAIDILRSDGYGPFVVFSDDRSWAWTELKATDVFMSPEADSDLHDLALMSQANALVTANSSFSWWAGWLVESTGGRVIAPDRWYRENKSHDRDLVPETWQRVTG